MSTIPEIPVLDQLVLDQLSHPIFATDSYKLSHFYQYDSTITNIYDHYINRGGDNVVFFDGLDYILKTYLSKPFTYAMKDLLEKYCTHHGVPFNKVGFNKLVAEYNGMLPLTIRAVPQKALYPSKLPLFSVQGNGDPDMVWCAGIVETLLMKVWYPSAVATKAFRVKQILKPYFEKTSKVPEMAINYAYHNFGARGSATEEQSLVGGMAHLNFFNGTDNFKSVIAHNIFFDSPVDQFVSIPATEHSTTCSVGKENEYQFVYDHVKWCVDNGYNLMAAVIDTYNTQELVERITEPGSPIRSYLEQHNAKLVLRPDSGDHLEELANIFTILHQNGCLYKNSKDYYTSDVFSVIWGDGTNEDTIKLMSKYWVEVLQGSMDILAFGSGGDLMQNVSRDTHKTAIKASSVLRNGKWVGISKSPIADASKKSLEGRVTTCLINDTYQVVDMDSPDYIPSTDCMEIVYQSGLE